MQKARGHGTKPLPPLVGGWFQVLFHSPARGSFHLSLTVLVRYRSSGNIQPCRMVPADSRRIPRVPRYSGSSLPEGVLRIRGCHPCRRRFPPSVLLLPSVRDGSPLPRRGRNHVGLGTPLFDRLYWGVHCCFLFLRLLRCFSSPGSLLYKVPYLQYGGSPHSDILGSKPVCGSPGLFAAYRVFLRFLKPRHPPSALVYFLYSLHGLYSSVRDCSVSRVKDLIGLGFCVFVPVAFVLFLSGE